MPNIRRILAGVAGRAFGRLLGGLEIGDLTWLARNLHTDRDAENAVALAKFSKAYHDIFYRNSSGDIRANGELRLLQRLSGLPMKVALDVGANIGNWTAAIKAAEPSIEVHAFEIVPDTARQMRQNIAGLNGIHLNEFGLGEAATEIEISFSPDNNVLSSAIEARRAEFPDLKDSWRTIRGKLLPGDDYVAQNRIEHVDFLKIDVEGMEMKVLSGFDRTFARAAIDIVQFEYAPLNKFIPLLLREFHDFFRSREFAVGKVYPKGVDFKEYETDDEDFVGLTYIACRSDRKDLIERIGYHR